ncbi:MAG: hypothetical protein LBB98_14970 [Treponema sp.]|jgi:hypothetical protein|nr:hypothetical protein [Treponema sp.]
MKKIIFLFSVSVLTFFSCYDMNTAPYPNLAGFHNASNSPFSNEEIRGIAGSGEQAVAVSGDKIAYSDDNGLTWKDPIILDSPTGLSLNCVIWGEGYYLTGGTGGSAAWSEDGKTWYAGIIGPMNPKNINAVAAGSLQDRKVFVAAGDDGRIAFAVDHPRGPWRMVSLSPFGEVDNYGEDIFALAWGYVGGNEKSGVFVAAGENGKIAFMRDLSGKWYASSQAGTTNTFRSVAFGNDRFVAVGDVGTIMISFDPASFVWERVEDTYIEARPLYSVSFDPAIKQFVAIGVNSLIAYSSTGGSWSVGSFQNQGRINAGGDLSAVACTNSRIILGCKDGLLFYSN